MGTVGTVCGASPSACQEKTHGKGETIGKGIKEKIKMSLPVYGSYYLGKKYLETEDKFDAVQNNNGDKNENTKKPGFLKSVFVGAAIKSLCSIPVLGSYLLGKKVLEQENALKEAKGENTVEIKKSDAFFEGIKTKLKLSVPLLSAHTVGKIIYKNDDLKNQ